jgi:hypothetical protein
MGDGFVSPKSVMSDDDARAAQEAALAESRSFAAEEPTGAVAFSHEPETTTAAHHGAKAEIRFPVDSLPEHAKPHSSTVDEPYQPEERGLKIGNSGAKQVTADEASNKAVQSADTKKPAKKTPAKKAAAPRARTNK